MVPLNQVEKWNKQRKNVTLAGSLEIVCLRVSVAFVSALLLSYVFCTEGDLRDVWLEGDLRFQGDWVKEGDSPNPLESSPPKTSTIPCCQTRPKENWRIHPDWVQRFKWARLLPFARLVGATDTSTCLGIDASLLTCLVD